MLFTLLVKILWLQGAGNYFLGWLTEKEVHDLRAFVTSASLSLPLVDYSCQNKNWFIIILKTSFASLFLTPCGDISPPLGSLPHIARVYTHCLQFPILPFCLISLWLSEDIFTWTETSNQCNNDINISKSVAMSQFLLVYPVYNSGPSQSLLPPGTTFSPGASFSILWRYGNNRIYIQEEIL